MTTNRFVITGVVVGAASMIGVGMWARVDPVGFADWAGWPNHEHFLHDAGVFQISIGLMLLTAVWWRHAVSVTLAVHLRWEGRRQRGQRRARSSARVRTPPLVKHNLDDTA